MGDADETMEDATVIGDAKGNSAANAAATAATSSTTAAGGKNVCAEKVERRVHVELGRGVRYLRHLSGASHGCLSQVSGGKQARRLRGGLGRLQPLFPQLLHEFVGE